MAYLNIISIIGNLGHECKISVGRTNGNKKASLNVACSERYKDANGEVKENTQWFNVVAYGKLADVCERLSLQRGTCVYVGGKMTFRTYTKEDGTKKDIAELVASTIQILSPKAQQAQESAQRETEETADDDLPF